MSTDERIPSYCLRLEDDTCARHGGKFPPAGTPHSGYCMTEVVLLEVNEERARQFAQYGTNASLEDGTGPLAMWVQPFAYYTADHVEAMFRADYEKHEARTGAPTWMHLVREEIAEAFKESSPERLEEELVQVAALCVSWVERIRERKLP